MIVSLMNPLKVRFRWLLLFWLKLVIYVCQQVGPEVSEGCKTEPCTYAGWWNKKHERQVDSNNTTFKLSVICSRKVLMKFFFLFSMRRIWFVRCFLDFVEYFRRSCWSYKTTLQGITDLFLCVLLDFLKTFDSISFGNSLSSIGKIWCRRNLFIMVQIKFQRTTWVCSS